MSTGMRGKLRASPGRVGEAPRPEIDAFRSRHLALVERKIATDSGHSKVTVDDAESPLAWLARRRGRDGRALIEPQQFQARERPRADFTSAHLMPHTTSNCGGRHAALRTYLAEDAGFSVSE